MGCDKLLRDSQAVGSLQGSAVPECRPHPKNKGPNPAMPDRALDLS
jgi:hypothetical protein